MAWLARLWRRRKPVEMRGLEVRLLDLHNAARGRAGLTPLRINGQLSDAAQAGAAWCASKGVLSHYTADGASPFDRIHDAGYRYAFAAENICEGVTTPEQAMQLWLDDPPHLANVLHPAFTEAGFGVAVAAGGRVYWFSDFGKPL